MSIPSSTEGTQISYQYITPRLTMISQCVNFLDIPFKEEKSRSGKTRKYRKIIGEKGKTPCRLELTEKGVATLTVWNKKYEKWILDQLTKYKVPEFLAEQIIRKIKRYSKRGDVALNFLKVPPEWYGKKIILPGLKIKLGDKSHQKNVEIEVDFQIKQEMDSIKDEISDLQKTISVLHTKLKMVDSNLINWIDYNLWSEGVDIDLVGPDRWKWLAKK